MTDRGDRIVSVLEEAFSRLMAADPAAFRHKFRKMAAEPFAFYRGSACLFYADMAELPDEWAYDRTGRIWIQGDLHAQNFGTYMDAEGTLVFDVNDFDEAYLGSFTWDVRRFAASMALLGWRKALPDSVITDLIRTYVTAYVAQVRAFATRPDDSLFSLRLDNTEGALHRVLQRARLETRIGLLNDKTYWYAVRAVQTDAETTAESPSSTRVAATPRDMTPPSAPTALVAVPSEGTARLSWRASPEPDVAGYIVYRTDPSGVSTRVGSTRAPDTTFTDHPVAPGSYRYEVAAYDTATIPNESARSDPATVSVP